MEPIRGFVKRAAFGALTCLTVAQIPFSYAITREPEGDRLSYPRAPTVVDREVCNYELGTAIGVRGYRDICRSDASVVCAAYTKCQVEILISSGAMTPEVLIGYSMTTLDLCISTLVGDPARGEVGLCDELPVLPPGGGGVSSGGDDIAIASPWAVPAM